MSIVWIHFQNIYLDKIRQSLLILITYPYFQVLQKQMIKELFKN